MALSPRLRLGLDFIPRLRDWIIPSCGIGSSRGCWIRLSQRLRFGLYGKANRRRANARQTMRLTRRLEADAEESVGSERGWTRAHPEGPAPAKGGRRAGRRRADMRGPRPRKTARRRTGNNERRIRAGWQRPGPRWVFAVYSRCGLCRCGSRTCGSTSVRIAGTPGARWRNRRSTAAASPKGGGGVAAGIVRTRSFYRIASGLRASRLIRWRHFVARGRALFVFDAEVFGGGNLHGGRFATVCVL